MSKVNKCPKCEGELALHKPNSKDEYLVCKRCNFKVKIKEKVTVTINLSPLGILKEETVSIPLKSLNLAKEETIKIGLSQLNVVSKKKTTSIKLEGSEK